MKAILISDYAKWCALMMNGEKTIEVRKNKALANAIRKLIKQYGKALIYVYCGKGKKLLFDKEQKIYFVGTHNANLEKHSADTDVYMNTAYELGCNNLNGKVVARFWCDEVYIYNIENRYTFFDSAFNETCEKLMGICSPKLYEYVGDKIFYGIHISKLEIFDRPKELGEFYKVGFHNAICKPEDTEETVNFYRITKAPQNYCYVEVE